MAVDANVLIYERIREENHLGRSIMSSLDSGFKRAFATIIDSNVTMFVAALILYLFGSGPVRGLCGVARPGHPDLGRDRRDDDPDDDRGLVPGQAADGAADLSRGGQVHETPSPRPENTKFGFMRLRRVHLPVLGRAFDRLGRDVHPRGDEFRHRFRRRHADRVAGQVGRRRSGPAARRSARRPASATSKCRASATPRT